MDPAVNVSSRLLLMRHAKSDWYNGHDDFSRPLARRGIKDALKMGKWLAEISLPDVVLCSPAKRTAETLDLLEVGGKLNLSEITEFVEELYHSSKESISECIKSHSLRGSIMVIGHNPGLEQLLIYLLEDSETLGKYQKPFPTGAIYELIISGGLDQLGRKSATLSNFMRPKLIC